MKPQDAYLFYFLSIMAFCKLLIFFLKPLYHVFRTLGIPGLQALSLISCSLSYEIHPDSSMNNFLALFWPPLLKGITETQLRPLGTKPLYNEANSQKSSSLGL